MILVDLEEYKKKNSKAWHQVKETLFKKEYYIEFLDHDQAFKACMYLLASKKRYLQRFCISFVHEKNRLYLVFVPPNPPIGEKENVDKTRRKDRA
jgi:hypothetical protein